MKEDAKTEEQERAQVSYAHRFLYLWGGLSVFMFCIAAVLTSLLVRVSLVESDYHPIGLYGDFQSRAVGWIYYEHRRRHNVFLVYYPARTTVVALPHGKFTGCTTGETTKTPLPAHNVTPSQYENRPFYLVTLSAEPHGTSAAGVLTCEIDFQARRESFTGYSMDVWFMPKPPAAAAPIATLNFSATIEGAEYMQVFGARSTSSSGADLEPDDEAIVKFTDIRSEGLRDVALVLIGAFVALGAAMALEAIRPYIEATANRRS